MAGLLDLALRYQPQLLAQLDAANPYPVDPEAAKTMAANFTPEDMVGPQLRTAMAARDAEANDDYRRGKWLALARAGFTAADQGWGAGANAGLNDLAGVIKEKKSARDKALERQTQLLMLDQSRANSLAQAAAGFYTKGIDAKSGNRISALNTSINLADKERDNARQSALAAYQMRSPQQIYEDFRKIMGPDEAMKMITGGNDNKTQMLFALKGRMNSLESLMKGGSLTPEQQAEYEALSKQFALIAGLGTDGAPATASGGLADLATTAGSKVKGGATKGAAATAQDQSLQTKLQASRMIAASGGNAETALARLKATPDSVISPGEKRIMAEAIKERQSFMSDVAKANGYK